MASSPNPASRNANAPLMAGEGSSGSSSRNSTNEDGSEVMSNSEPSTPVVLAGASSQTPNRFIYLLTLSAGISGLLFGYDTGVISSTLISIKADLSQRFLTTADKSLITAITSFAALLCAPLTGWLADRYGRKRVILVSNLLFILGAVLQAVAQTVWFMVVGRAAVGAAVGMASGVVPLYISEMAPADKRGRFVTIQSLFITGGQVVAYLVGWALARTPGGWRWMVGLGALPAAVQLALLFAMPETPRWLVKVDRDHAARNVLQKICRGSNPASPALAAEEVLSHIKTEIADEIKTFGPKTNFSSTLTDLLFTPGNRRALTIACTLQSLQQLCGFNSLMYFSATIFSLLGYHKPIATSLTIAGTNFLSTLAAFTYIDRAGRRNMLLRSIPLMILGLLIAATAFHALFPGGHMRQTSPFTDDSHAATSAWPHLLLAALMLYVASYAIGLGCVPWQQSELFPLRVRSVGSALSTSTNWSCNFLVGMTFLPMMEVLGPSLTFLLYALVCAGGWWVVWRIYPETAGLELEDIGELLKDGWGVGTSVRRFRDGKRGMVLVGGE
ncbi:hypothetical protein MBLNU230_g1612t1 [Neophaeotheca triangularis]